MRGQLIKRGENIWCVRIFLGRDAETGKRRYFNHTVHGNKKSAQAYLTAALRDQDLGRFQDPSHTTLGEYMKQWLQKAAKPKLRERSFLDYQFVVKRYISPSLGHVKLMQLRPLAIQNFYLELRERGLSPASIRKTHTVLSSSLDQGVRWGMLGHNPALSVELPRNANAHQRKELLVLTPEEAGRFLEACKENRWGALFSFALQTGARPGEYLALQWKDIDWQRRIAHIRRTIYRARSGGGWRYEETKTALSKRAISLPAALMAELDELREYQEAEKKLYGDEYTDHDLVFAGITGEPLCASNLLHRYFRPLLAAAGLNPRITLYTMRHTHATLLLIAGVNPKVVADRLGHSSIKLTLDVYSHVVPGLQEAAVDKLDLLLRPSSREPEES